MDDKIIEGAAGFLLTEILDKVTGQDSGYILKEYTDGGADIRELLKVFADEDTVKWCFCLFANDLNASLAAKKLYMHRNTLLYRINKLKASTGLDVRKFPDAVTFIVLYGACRRNGLLSFK